jgi:hypothetical protein
MATEGTAAAGGRSLNAGFHIWGPGAMSRPAYKKDKHKDVVRALAVQDLQLLLGAEPHLVKAFQVLAQRAKANELQNLCKEGVSYTRRRVDRIKEALRKLDAPQVSRPSSGLGGLISRIRSVRVPGSKARKPMPPSWLPLNEFRISVWQSIRPSTDIFGLLMSQKLGAYWSRQQRKSGRQSAKWAG